MMKTSFVLATLGLVLAPALAAVPVASATTCNAFGPFFETGDPALLVAGVRCIVRAEVCLFTEAIRPGWCPV